MVLVSILETLMKKNDNLHLVINPSRLRITEEGNDFTLDGKFFDSLLDKLNPKDPEYKDKFLDVSILLWKS